jgi:hypothetical protein
MTDEPSDDISLVIQGIQFGSRTIALTMAEMICDEVYGVGEAQAQAPFEVTEAPDRWIIVGSRSYDDPSSSVGQILEGPVEIEILKANCRVVKCVRKLDIGY